MNSWGNFEAETKDKYGFVMPAAESSDPQLEALQAQLEILRLQRLQVRTDGVKLEESMGTTHRASVNAVVVGLDAQESALLKQISARKKELGRR